MKLIDREIEIEYPESDGKPMGETDLHRDSRRKWNDCVSRFAKPVAGSLSQRGLSAGR